MAKPSLSAALSKAASGKSPQAEQEQSARARIKEIGLPDDRSVKDMMAARR